MTKKEIMNNVKDEIANQDIKNTAKIVRISMELMELKKLELQKRKNYQN